jgi:hypothetical protein
MSTSSIAAIIALGAAGATTFIQTTGMDTSWRDLASGGAAMLVIFVVVLFLRNQNEMRKEHSDTVIKLGSDFSDAIKASSREFAESTQKLIEGSRQHNQANMAMLQSIIQDLKDAK